MSDTLHIASLEAIANSHTIIAFGTDGSPRPDFAAAYNFDIAGALAFAAFARSVTNVQVPTVTGQHKIDASQAPSMGHNGNTSISS